MSSAGGPAVPPASRRGPKREPRERAERARSALGHAAGDFRRRGVVACISHRDPVAARDGPPIADG
jgi:hypothetical protein